MPWPISVHETPDVDLVIPGVTAPHYLWAILSADGEHFREENYERVREYLQEAVNAFSKRRTGGQKPKVDVSDSRLRTWKTAFEDMGLLTIDVQGHIRATRFGRAVIDGLAVSDDAVTRANRRIATLGAQVANRILLAKPEDDGRPADVVPADSDLLPLRAVWRAFRRLGNRLHWQDINRVLGHVHYERDVEAAIDRIVGFRAAYPDNYADPAVLSAHLGSDQLSTDPRHITPWINRAGIGGMLIPSEPDADGFRTLPEASVTVIDELLGERPPVIPAEARTNRGAYVTYLMAPVEVALRPAVTLEDATIVERVSEAVKVFGAKRFITLSGLPATGKTRLAKIVADQLTDGDPLRLKEIQFHENTTYEDFMEGYVARKDGQGFERHDKTFRIINQRALDDPDKVYVLLIEEFTRANLHAVIGELLTFIEHRGRNFTLSLSQDETSVAPNLVVLATMNPRDRSALTLDHAVTRRMHRISVPPSTEALRNMLQAVLDVAHLERLALWFDRHSSILPFGHGVFVGADSPEKLASIWQATVLPLLSDPRERVLEAYSEACADFPFGGSEMADATPP